MPPRIGPRGRGAAGRPRERGRAAVRGASRSSRPGCSSRTGATCIRATRDTAAWSLGLHRRPDGVPAPRPATACPLPAAAADRRRRAPSTSPPRMSRRPPGAGARGPGAGARGRGPARARARAARRARIARGRLAARAGAAGARCSLPSRCSPRSAWLTSQGPGLRGGGAELGARGGAVACAGGVLGRHERGGLAARAAARAARSSPGRVAPASARRGRGGHARGPLRRRASWAPPCPLLGLCGITRSPRRSRWLPLGLGVLGVGAAGLAAAQLLAPLRPRAVADALDRRRAAALVRRHGSDTLSAFKLRATSCGARSADGRAMVAYRVDAGALCSSPATRSGRRTRRGDARDSRAFARRHGLRARRRRRQRATFADSARRAGLRRAVPRRRGDAARPARWTSPGGARKSLRKAVNRVGAQRLPRRAERGRRPRRQPPSPSSRA